MWRTKLANNSWNGLIGVITEQVLMQTNKKFLISIVFSFYPKGGQKLCPESILCRITCDDNQVFGVKACINGTIVEINTKLIDNYDLLTQKVSFQ